MKVIATPEAPPLAYAESSPLKNPGRELQFSEIEARIALFTQESLVTLGMALLWKIHHNPELVSEKSGAGWMARSLVAQFADRLISLACLQPREGGHAATEADFVLLCWELHNSPEAELSDLAREGLASERLQAVEDVALRTALLKVPIRGLLAEGYRARAASFAIAHEGASFEQMIRPMLIGEGFATALTRRFGVPARNTFHNHLQGEVVEFCRNALVLNALLDSGTDITPPGGARVHVDGLVHLKDGPIGDGEISRLGVTGEGLRALALRGARRLDGFEELRVDRARIPPTERKFSEQMNWLGRWPLIDFGVDGLAQRVGAPSPKRFGQFIERYLLHEAPYRLVADGVRGDNRVLLTANDTTSLRGEAFGSYLRDTLIPKGLVDADTLGVSGKHPDFIWGGKTQGVLVEAKFSLTPNADRALTNFSAVVTTWERAWEAFVQIVSFVREAKALLSARWPAIRTWVGVLVVNDPWPDEGTRFKAILKRTGLVPQELAGVAVVSAGELERWVAGGDAEPFVSEVVRSWTSLDLSGVSDDLSLGDAPAVQGLLPHLATALRVILPQVGETLIQRMSDRGES